MAKGIIYQIQNLVTGWIYVGSTLNEKSRLARHLRHLKKGKHVNKSLQQDFDEYGEINFEFSVLHRDIAENDLHLFESSAITVLQIENEGRVYNVSRTPRISPKARKRLAQQRMQRLALLCERDNRWLQKPCSLAEIKNGKLPPTFLTGSTLSGTLQLTLALPLKTPS